MYPAASLLGSRVGEDIPTRVVVGFQLYILVIYHESHRGAQIHTLQTLHFTICVLVVGSSTCSHTFGPMLFAQTNQVALCFPAPASTPSFTPHPAPRHHGSHREGHRFRCVAYHNTMLAGSSCDSWIHSSLQTYRAWKHVAQMDSHCMILILSFLVREGVRHCQSDRRMRIKIKVE